MHKIYFWERDLFSRRSIKICLHHKERAHRSNVKLVCNYHLQFIIQIDILNKSMWKELVEGN